MDEVVTHADVLRWLPSDVQEALEAAMDPHLRGWYTETEAEADGGRFVAVQKLEWRQPRYIRTG